MGRYRSYLFQTKSLFIMILFNMYIKLYIDISNSFLEINHMRSLSGDMSDSVTNYNYVGNTKVSVSIKKPNANKCTLSEIFLTEILKSFSMF